MSDATKLLLVINVWLLAFHLVFSYTCWYIAYHKMDPKTYVYNWRIFVRFGISFVFPSIDYERWLDRNE